MTAKETAEQLVSQYEIYTRPLFALGDYENEKHYNKQCALLAVEFARREFENHCAAEYGTDGSPDNHFNTIKQELEKL